MSMDEEQIMKQEHKDAKAKKSLPPHSNTKLELGSRYLNQSGNVLEESLTI